MSWFINFLTSSIGQKIVMSLTGLFLCTFLIAHLSGNFQLLYNDDGAAFNAYAKFMTTFPLVKAISYLLYGSILLHAIQGILLWWKNKQAKGQKYAVKTRKNTTYAARNMAFLGTIIFIFIVIHMRGFWYEMHFGDIGVDAAGNKDLYKVVEAAFSNIVYVSFYVLAMVALALHLWHGFQSSFQTLGLNHKKYTPIIRFVGAAFSIVVPALFALIPIAMFLSF